MHLQDGVDNISIVTYLWRTSWRSCSWRSLSGWRSLCLSTPSIVIRTSCSRSGQYTQRHNTYYKKSKIIIIAIGLCTMFCKYDYNLIRLGSKGLRYRFNAIIVIIAIAMVMITIVRTRMSFYPLDLLFQASHSPGNPQWSKALCNHLFCPSL